MKQLVHAFRHGETDWNAGLRLQGHVDVPLNENGRSQARALAQSLRGSRIDAVLSSDLSRALETARPVADATGAPLTVDPRLRETALGQAEGLTPEEVAGTFGQGALAAWRSHAPGDASYAFPGGEGKAAALMRAKSALEDFLLASPGAAEIAACTHGGILRRFIHWVKPDFQSDEFVRNCAVYDFEFEPKARLWTALF